MKKYLLLYLLLTSLYTYSQEVKTISFGIEGQVAASTNGEGVFVNFGGPGIKLKTRYFNISFNMMPSIRFQEDITKPLVTPILGTGPQIYFLKNKRLLFTFPAYYYITSQKWIFTAGIGYVLTNGK
jgi:hypothetical protein